MNEQSIPRRLFLKNAGAAGLAASLPAPSQAQTDAARPGAHPADLVLKNGKIITVDRDFTIAQALAIAGDRKVPALPDVPTAAEQGLKFEAMGWQALFVPRSTPRGVIEQLNTAARAAFADVAVRKRLLDLGNELPPATDQTPEAMGRFLKSEIDKWVPVIKKAGIAAQ